MSLSILLTLAQAGSTQQHEFDLRSLARDGSCTAGGNIIIVCGRTSVTDRQRLPKESQPYIDHPPVAQVALPNGWKINLHGEALHLPGAESNRAVITVKVPL